MNATDIPAIGTSRRSFGNSPLGKVESFLQAHSDALAHLADKGPVNWTDPQLNDHENANLFEKYGFRVNKIRRYRVKKRVV
jgi:hypothetical protein